MTGNDLADRLPELDPDDPLYATAQATRRAYASDWRDFASWGAANGLSALPATPSTIALYLTSHTALLDRRRRRIRYRTTLRF